MLKGKFPFCGIFSPRPLVDTEFLPPTISIEFVVGISPLIFHFPLMVSRHTFFLTSSYHLMLNGSHI